MVNAVREYLNKLNSVASGGARVLFFRKDVFLAADTSITLEIKSVFPEYLDYDLRSADINVRVLDTVSNLYLESPHLAISGIRDDGRVIIRNISSSTVKIQYKVTAPTKKGAGTEQGQ